MEGLFSPQFGLMALTAAISLAILCPVACVLTFRWAQRASHRIAVGGHKGTHTGPPCSAASLCFEVLPLSMLLASASLAIVAEILSFRSEADHQSWAFILFVLSMVIGMLLIPAYLALGAWRRLSRHAGRRVLLASVAMYYALPSFLLVGSIACAAVYAISCLERQPDGTRPEAIVGLPPRIAIIGAAGLAGALGCMCYLVCARLSLRWLQPSASTVANAGMTLDPLEDGDAANACRADSSVSAEMLVEDLDTSGDDDALHMERQLRRKWNPQPRHYALRSNGAPPPWTSVPQQLQSTTIIEEVEEAADEMDELEELDCSSSRSDSTK